MSTNLAYGYMEWASCCFLILVYVHFVTGLETAPNIAALTSQKRAIWAKVLSNIAYTSYIGSINASFAQDDAKYAKDQIPSDFYRGVIGL